MGFLWLLVPGVALGLAAVVLAAMTFFGSRIAVARYRLLLIGSVLGAAGALLAVTGWLLGDPGTPRGDALKTGGLAGGAILAVYALWINDRRRRTEEARHEVERGRAQQDRERTENEQFAKAVELLGHGADQVRVGALHALAGLARSRPAYTQTVLDVLCAYLRRPFTHPGYDTRPDNPDEAEPAPDSTWPAERIAEADREQQVRLTAQRLIAALLPGPADEQAVPYDLDLTAANLEYLDLTGRRLGRLIARRARLHGVTNLTKSRPALARYVPLPRKPSGRDCGRISNERHSNRLGDVRIQGPALFSGATFHGRTELSGARFDGGLSLLKAELKGPWRVSDAQVREFADLRTPAPEGSLGALTLVGDVELKVDEGSGWATSLLG
ncbi:hypothetical protein [Amycolatopsis sp. RTGN1]|uniref:hypothetical protein n=1 Tax=Amycolatopsis ponsaeliensis TaxID=2992142 RepID=UPI00254DAE22|nr:hypothetical protein [Amycolatopsis sp. RTGN1]